MPNTSCERLVMVDFKRSRDIMKKCGWLGGELIRYDMT